VVELVVVAACSLSKGCLHLHCLPAHHHQQSHFQNAIIGGLAGLANRTQEMVGTEAEVDDDVAGSALEDLAAGGLDGFEWDAFLQIVKSVLVAILEVIGL
jgi:hypothetical protein